MVNLTSGELTLRAVYHSRETVAMREIEMKKAVWNKVPDGFFERSRQ
jgi:hypothetical protein